MKLIKKILLASAASTILATGAMANADLVAQGEKIFKTKNLGNCVACHAINGKSDIAAMGPGSMGPKLTGLSYWDEKTLYDTVYDIYSARDTSNVSMPAYGKSGWLSSDQITALVAYLKTIN